MTSSSARGLAATTALTALLGVLSGCGIGRFQMSPPLHEETRTLTIPHQKEAAVEVETVNGPVTVSQCDRDDVQIVAYLSAVSPERLAAAEVVADRTESGMLSVSVDWPEGKPLDREGCGFEVFVPDGVDVTLRTTNGGISLTGLGGKADLHTANGTIKVDGHSGPVSAETSNGRIEIDGATGPVKAKTSNGTVAVSLAPEGSGPIDADTDNGSIILELSPAAQGRLTLTTKNGSIQVDPSCEAEVVSEQKNQVVLDLGGSDDQSSATTSNGSIQVKRQKGL